MHLFLYSLICLTLIRLIILMDIFSPSNDGYFSIKNWKWKNEYPTKRGYILKKYPSNDGYNSKIKIVKIQKISIIWSLLNKCINILENIHHLTGIQMMDITHSLISRRLCSPCGTNSELHISLHFALSWAKIIASSILIPFLVTG